MSQAKTEPPSHKKLRDARKKGDVPYSKDFSQSILLVALLSYALYAGSTLLPALTQLIQAPVDLYGLPFRQALAVAGTRCLDLMLRVVLPFLGILLGLGILADVLQVGFLVAFEKIKPSGKKLNVVENAKNLVSARNLVETIKAVAKISGFSCFIYLLIRDAVRPLAYAGHAGIGPFFLLVSQFLKTLLLYVALLCTVIAALDLAWQRRQRTKRLRMTKQEVKREHKEQEGSPEIKQKRRQIRQEDASVATELARKATAVVANPTHIAIALYYEAERTPLPVLLAKGCDEEALDMIAAAKDEGVPVMRDIPLARRLYADAPVEAYIPTEFIEPVAAVLRWVRSLDAEGGAEPGGNDAVQPRDGPAHDDASNPRDDTHASGTVVGDAARMPAGDEPDAGGENKDDR